MKSQKVTTLTIRRSALKMALGLPASELQFLRSRQKWI
jgi:hypothetical protein